MEKKEYPTPTNPIPIEKQTQIIELERRDVQSQIRYWNKKYIDTFLELVKEKVKNKKLEDVMDLMAEDIGKSGDSILDIKLLKRCCVDIDTGDILCLIKEYYFKKARGE